MTGAFWALVRWRLGSKAKVSSLSVDGDVIEGDEEEEEVDENEEEEEEEEGDGKAVPSSVGVAEREDDENKEVKACFRMAP